MYSDKVQKELNEAQETNVANKIMDLLGKLQLNNDESSACRWVWELIQNAKDVVNSTGKVDIKINFDENKKILQFEHNGRLFTTKNLVYLVSQVSAKERADSGEKNERVTGKFGTGFLTTHLLSEKVNVSGILHDEGEASKKFDVELDRSGKDKETIIRAIHKSYEQLDGSEELPEDVVIDENQFNTSFTYQLSPSGMEVAIKGLENLYIALPYVFVFVPEIETVSVNIYDSTFKRGDIYGSKHENITVQEILCNENGEEYKKYISVFCKDGVSIAIEVNHDKDVVNIQEFSLKLPKIFCDFPLIGTEDFSFPVVINSSCFNPTEPRDGIYLTDKENDKVKENKSLMLTALNYYIELLDYVSKQDWQYIYYIVKIKPQSEKSWLSKTWFKETIIDKCKEHIRYAEIIDSAADERKALYDWLDNDDIFIISDVDKNIREAVWDLAEPIMSDMLTRRMEIHNWYDSLWRQCRKFSLKDLLLKVQEMGNIEKLSEELGQNANVVEWLNKLYELISTADTVDFVLNEKIKIFINQNGDFCESNELFIDADIDEKYKDILLLLDVDCRDKLLNKDLVIGNWVEFQKYDYENIFEEIQASIHEFRDKEGAAYKQLIVLYDAASRDMDEQIDLVHFVDAIFPNYLPVDLEVNKVSEELLCDAMKYWLMLV